MSTITLDFDDSVYALIEADSVPYATRRHRDRKHYKLEWEDAAVRSSSEAGYEFTRPRFRRTNLRRMFTFGYTDLSLAQRDILYDFWNSSQGGSFAFYWVNRDELTGKLFELGQTTVPTQPQIQAHSHIVRFLEAPSISASSYGPRQRFDAILKIKEV